MCSAHPGPEGVAPGWIESREVALVWIPGIAGAPTNVDASGITSTFLVTVILYQRRGYFGSQCSVEIQSTTGRKTPSQRGCMTASIYNSGQKLESPGPVLSSLSTPHSRQAASPCDGSTCIHSGWVFPMQLNLSKKHPPSSQVSKAREIDHQQ